MTLGEETASTLGINLRSVRLRLIFGVTASVGAATAVAGTIGFVGLVVPHLLRPFVEHRPSLLLPASALGGAALLMLSDVDSKIAFLQCRVETWRFYRVDWHTNFFVGRAENEKSVSMSVLSATGIEVIRGNQIILSNTSFSVKNGELVGLIGPNGRR